MATGETLSRFEGHEGRIAAVAFAPDGRSVATAGSDTTALVWDVSGLGAKVGPPRRILDTASIKACWDNLSNDDPAIGCKAANALAGSPERSVPFLRDRLKSIAVADPEKLDRWIADLSSDKFAIRQAATKELEKLGQQAEPFLQMALKRNTTLETRLRLEQILKTLADVPSPDTLRTIRAIMTLERIGSAERAGCLRIFGSWCSGSTGDRGSPGVLATAGPTNRQDAMTGIKMSNSLLISPFHVFSGIHGIRGFHEFRGIHGFQFNRGV